MKIFKVVKYIAVSLMVLSLGILIGNELVVKYVMFRSEIIGSSMYPTYVEGEQVWVNRLKEPVRGNVVIVDEGDKLVIKRLIGMPGDTIQIIEGVVYIDGEVYEEPYVSVEQYNPGILVDEITLSDGMYFILGDNRVVSKDSREIGAIPRDNIVGVVVEQR